MDKNPAPVMAEVARAALLAADAAEDAKYDIKTKLTEAPYSAALYQELRAMSGRLVEISGALRILSRAEDPTSDLWAEERASLASGALTPDLAEQPTRQLHAA
jgi:hypothetical protein